MFLGIYINECFMKSLLVKVQQIEKEIADRLDILKKEHRAKLSELVGGEGKVISNAKEVALERGNSIINERKKKAEADVNSLKQGNVISLKGVRENADKNRDSAVIFLEEMLRREFIKKK